MPETKPVVGINLVIQAFGDTNPFSLGDEIHLVADDSDVERTRAYIAALLDELERLREYRSLRESDLLRQADVAAERDSLKAKLARVEETVSWIAADLYPATADLYPALAKSVLAILKEKS